jgi:hypothetical protein
MIWFMLTFHGKGQRINPLHNGSCCLEFAALRMTSLEFHRAKRARQASPLPCGGIASKVERTGETPVPHAGAKAQGKLLLFTR